MEIKWRQVFIAFIAGMIIQSSGLVNEEMSWTLADNNTDNSTNRSLNFSQRIDFNSEPLNETKTERLVHEEINEERTQRGLSKLKYSGKLGEIAEGHSQDMAQRNYFSHNSPEGEDFSDRYDEAGYLCQVREGRTIYKGAENIANTHYQRRVSTKTGTITHENEQELAEGLVNQWMNSKGHRKNILKPYWNHEGIGIHITEDNKVYATQNFC